MCQERQKVQELERKNLESERKAQESEMKAIEALRLLEESKRMKVEADAGPLRRTRGSAVTGQPSVRCHSWPPQIPDDDLASCTFLFQLFVTSILIWISL